MQHEKQGLTPTPKPGRQRVPQLRFTAAAAILCAALVLMLADIDPPAQLVLVALGVVYAWLRLGLGVPVWLALCLGYRAWLDVTYARQHPFSGEIVLAVLAIGLITFSYRYFELHPGPWRLSWRGTGSGRPDSDQSVRLGQRQVRPLRGGWLAVPVALAIALLVLWAFPIDAQAPERYGLTPPALRCITIVWVLALATVLLRAALNRFAWRRLSPLQARVYVRHALARQLRGEFTLVSRARRRVGDTQQAKDR